MPARCILLIALIGGVARAEEPESESIPTRVFIGGFTAGAFTGPGAFSGGPLGVAFDLGLQLNRQLSVSVQFRASTFIIAHQFLVTPSVEWSFERISAAVGFGGAILLGNQLELRPALATPFGFGLTLGEYVRINLEFAFLLAPAPWNLGGTAGISVGFLSR